MEKASKLAKLLAGSMVFLSLILGIGSLGAYAQEGGDIENPSDVETLTATPLNGAVKLEWSAASDDTAVTGYKIFYGLESVSEPGVSYDFDEDVGDVLEYTVEDLENDTLYYFSVIAYDAAGNESVFWAPEASATPSSDLGDAGDTSDDTDAPQVASAEAVYMNTVKVVFSEAVELPSNDPQDAFSIENQDTLEQLNVNDAKLDPSDTTDKTVLLTTDDQESGVEYLLTVGIDVRDKAGNPIISGTSDTAVFTGTDTEMPANDTEPPRIESIEVIDDENILIHFNEAVIIPGVAPEENFRILEEDDATKSLTVLGVTLGTNSAGVENASAVVKTDPQSEVAYLVIVSGVTDEAGNEIEPASGSAKFQGAGGDGGETDGGEDDNGEVVQPKDVAELLANKIFEAGAYVVKLSWKIPEGQASNILEQVIYMSQDKGDNYAVQGTVAPDVTEYEVNGLAAGDYWFKITQKDDQGNETEGTVIQLNLPETGPGVVGLVLGSLGLGHFVTRRKKNKRVDLERF